MNVNQINRKDRWLFPSTIVLLLVVSTFTGVATTQEDGLFGDIEVIGNTRTGSGSLTMNSRFHDGPIWNISATNHLAITNSGGKQPFSIFENSPALAIGLSEFGVGIGTLNAEEALHVRSAGSSAAGFDEARMVIEGDYPDTALRSMMLLKNNGPVRFELNNTQRSETWAFQTNHSDGFLINRLGSGGNEFSIRKSGMVTMGPGGALNFVLHPNGNLDIAGAFSQLSDRDSKENIGSVDCHEILDQVTRLPITTWKYKDDVESIRHIGPMAQDFHSLFGLGKNDTTIATVDAEGVVLAAAQALANENQTIEDKIEELQGRICDIESLSSH